MLRRALSLLGLCLISAQAVAAGYQITDSFGKHWFERVPERVVVTDWTVLDNLLRLGIVPVGAPDTADYRKLPNQPELPTAVSDIGLRAAPSPASIRALKPDLIIIGTGQKELARPLSRIAKVIYFKNFSDRYRTNGRKSRERWLQMAAVFAQTEQAQQALSGMDQRLAELAQRVRGAGPVALIQARDDGSLRLYGDNSLPGYALRQLGLTPALQRAPKHWGESAIKTADLNTLQEPARILLFAPLKQHEQWRKRLTDGAIDARIELLAPLWPYGGALSILQLAERIATPLR